MHRIWCKQSCGIAFRYILVRMKVRQHVGIVRLPFAAMMKRQIFQRQKHSFWRYRPAGSNVVVSSLCKQPSSRLSGSAQACAHNVTAPTVASRDRQASGALGAMTMSVCCSKKVPRPPRHEAKLISAVIGAQKVAFHETLPSWCCM